MNAPEKSIAGSTIALSRSADGKVATITLNRPDQFNAMSEQLLADLTDGLTTLGKDESVRVIVLAGAGKAFCAGHDLREMMGEPSTEYYQQLFASCTKMMMTLHRVPQPVIARVHGIATAAGCQLVAMCDLAVASNEAKFAVSGVNLGLFCSTPSVPLSRNLSRKDAFEMLVTGRFIDANEAREKGLINRVSTPEALDDDIAQLANEICSKPAVAISAGKQLFYRQLETGIEAAYQMAGQTMACNMMAGDTLEGVQAFLDKRTPDWG
jgi:enoyl-CoA hydratase/carnithine racemase